MRHLLWPAVIGIACFALAACGVGAKSAAVPVDAPSPAPEATAASNDDFLVGKPQNRAGIGDVDRVFERYADTRADMIAQYRAQPWFKDGLTRDEALFVERGLTFVASYSGPRRAYVRPETIEQKLFKYERVPVQQGEVELLLIYEPGQDAEREMTVLRNVIPALEAMIGVQFPERVLTVINGNFEINDFNDGQFIRIASCCTLAPSILAHELSHTYWSMAPSWFDEGMADIYSNLVIARLNKEAPSGWRNVPVDVEAYYRSRKSLFESGRFPDMILPRRLASDGLYEVADYFLLDIRHQIGETAFTEAVREIYLASDFGRVHLRDKRLEDKFLKHSRPDQRQGIMDLFNRMIWGDNGERYHQLQELDGT